MKPKPKPKKKKKALWTKTKGGIKPRERRGYGYMTIKQRAKFWSLLLNKKVTPEMLPPLPRKRIRPISQSLARRRRCYASEVRIWLADKTCVGSGMTDAKGKPVCSMQIHPATENHHLRGRITTLLMDKRFWCPVCSALHRWIDANRAEARKLGLLCQQGEWNKVLKEAA